MDLALPNAQVSYSKIICLPFLSRGVDLNVRVQTMLFESRVKRKLSELVCFSKKYVFSSFETFYVAKLISPTFSRPRLTLQGQDNK